MQIIKLWLKISALLGILGWVVYFFFGQPTTKMPKVVATPIVTEPESPEKPPQSPAAAPGSAYKLNE